MVHMGYAISDVVTDIIIILMPVGEVCIACKEVGV
jgi:hypothetical protein